MPDYEQPYSPMHALSIIKSHALDALDEDSEEHKEYRMAEFRSIADPLTVLEMAKEIERRPIPSFMSSCCSYCKK